MDLDLYYKLDRRKMGTAVIINNLHTEQTPTRKDVESLSGIFQKLGFDVEIHQDLTSKQMNDLKRSFTEEEKHRESNCFLLLVISHGTADNFIQCSEGTKTWNIECLVTEVSEVRSLEGRPKLFFIEACRGRDSNSLMTPLMTKSGSLPPSVSGISLPSKQDVFVGFATVPGFVSFTSGSGSPYLQALAGVMGSPKASSLDLSDIHLIVKRQLANTKLAGGNRQGAEERSSLLYKLLFSEYSGNHKGSLQVHCNQATTNSSDLANKVTSLGPLSRPVPIVIVPSNKPNQEIRPLSVINIRREAETPEESVNPRPISSSSVTISPSLAAWRAYQDSRKNISASTLVLNSAAKPPRSAMINYSNAGSQSSGFCSNNKLGTEKPSVSTFESKPKLVKPEIRSTQIAQGNKCHEVEISSDDVEAGLKLLLEKVQEVHGGRGKVKRRKNSKFSVKFVGPEGVAKMLDNVLKSIEDLQRNETGWKFSQKIEESIL